MVAALPKKQLLDLLLRAVNEGGWRALVASSAHPFLLRLYRDDERGFGLRIYVWNCTHGGGKNRAADEYRIQFTGVVPKKHSGEITLLLGWHDGYQVFAGWDISRHSGQDSKSPSAQVKEDALANAHVHAFSIHRRHNSEIVVAFRPEFLVDYARNAETLHKPGSKANALSLLNSLDTITDEQLGTIPNKERRIILSQIARKYRAQDFRRRVLGAYEHHCAVCGVQLELIDAAHIVPVADPASTDETSNGLALCKLHHAAFDRNLVSIDENYKIELSETEIARLENVNLAGGLSGFKKHLKSAIILPADRRDYPNPIYIKQARSIRKWAA